MNFCHNTANLFKKSGASPLETTGIFLAQFRKMLTKIFSAIAIGIFVACGSYFLIGFLDSFYGEMLPAFCTGGVCGFAAGGKRRIMLSAVICAIGWLLGAILFGEIMNLGIGPWIIASIFVVIAAIEVKSIFRVGMFFFIALFSGIAIEISRYLTLFEPLRTIDMQLLLLISAGILLPPICVMACSGSRRKHHEHSEIRAA